MKIIDADKLHVDKQINGKFWISAEQIINAKTVEAIPLSVIEKIHDAIDNAESDTYIRHADGSKVALSITKEHVNEIIDKVVKGVDK